MLRLAIRHRPQNVAPLPSLIPPTPVGGFFIFQPTACRSADFSNTPNASWGIRSLPASGAANSMLQVPHQPFAWLELV